MAWKPAASVRETPQAMLSLAEQAHAAVGGAVAAGEIGDDLVVKP